jgi:hypothetical protein
MTFLVAGFVIALVAHTCSTMRPARGFRGTPRSSHFETAAGLMDMLTPTDGAVMPHPHSTR